MNSKSGYQAIGVLMVGGGMLTMYTAYKGGHVKSVIVNAIQTKPSAKPTTAAATPVTGKSNG